MNVLREADDDLKNAYHSSILILKELYFENVGRLPLIRALDRSEEVEHQEKLVPVLLQPREAYIGLPRGYPSEPVFLVPSMQEDNLPRELSTLNLNLDKHKCTCDFYSVLLRYGCQCGGK